MNNVNYMNSQLHEFIVYGLLYDYMNYMNNYMNNIHELNELHYYELVI